MHQKQPPPNVADSVLFGFMELVGSASADKFNAPAASKKQIVCFIFPFAKFIPFQANQSLFFLRVGPMTFVPRSLIH
jgi:hypothetical protein